MEKNTRTKNILLIVLLVAVLTLSISYAALQQTLTINSQATVGGKNTNWNVRFTNVSCTANAHASIDTPFSSTNTTSLTGLAVTLKAPGDNVVCDITISNLGTLDADLATFTLNAGSLSYTSASQTPATAQADEALVGAGLVDYSIVYATGDADAGEEPGSQDVVSDLIAAPQSPATQTDRHVILTIGIDSNKTEADLPSDDVTITGFSTTFLYEQA